MPGSELLRALREIESAAGNINSHGSDGLSVAESYLSWVSDAARRLRLLVAAVDLGRLVHTGAYWTVLTMANPSAAPPLMRALHDEIAARQQDTRTAVETLDAFLRSWESVPKPAALVVVDTNVLLHHEQELGRIAWHDVIWL